MDLRLSVREKQMLILSFNADSIPGFRSLKNSPALWSPLKSFWRKLNIFNAHPGKRLAMISDHCNKFMKLSNTSQINFSCQIAGAGCVLQGYHVGSHFVTMSLAVLQSLCPLVLKSLRLSVPKSPLHFSPTTAFFTSS